MDEYNNPIFTTLQKIEGVSSSLEMRVRWISRDINELVNLPEWETQAEDALAKAEEQLQRTLQIMQQARKLLATKREKNHGQATDRVHGEISH